MPGKSKFTPKQDRQVAHIVASEKKAHPKMSDKQAKSIAYGTVNAQKSKKTTK